MNGDEPRDASYISSSELRGQARAVRPRDAATLLIVRREGPGAAGVDGQAGCQPQVHAEQVCVPGRQGGCGGQPYRAAA